jgi:hypothetical protein
VIPVCGSCTERGKASDDTADLSGRERERVEAETEAASSTLATRAGGPAHSSSQAAAAGVEGRGRLTGVVSLSQSEPLGFGRNLRGRDHSVTTNGHAMPGLLVWEVSRLVVANEDARPRSRGAL